MKSGLTARQSGELDRIAARYGALRWRLRDDGAVAVAVLGDHPEPRYEVLLMLMRADGTPRYLSHWTPRHDRISAPQAGQQEPPQPANELAPPPWPSPAHHAGAPATTHG